MSKSLKGIIKEVFKIENPCLLIHDKDKNNYNLVSLSTKILDGMDYSKKSFDYFIKLFNENPFLLESQAKDYLSRKISELNNKFPEIILSTIDKLIRRK